MLFPLLLAATLGSALAGREARLLQAPQTTTSEGCPAGTFVDLASHQCLLCHRSCSRCSVPLTYKGPRDQDCSVCAGLRIFLGERRHDKARSGGALAFVRLCGCPRHHEENPAGDCEPTHAELKVGLGFAVLVFGCLCLATWFMRRACPKSFGKHRRVAAQAYLEAVAKHRTTGGSEEDELKSSDRQFSLKEPGSSPGISQL